MSNIRKLTRTVDGRGSGVYNLFDKLPKGQINIGKTHKGVFRSFHVHRKQTDFWFPINGKAHVCLITIDEEKLTKFITSNRNLFPCFPNQMIMYSGIDDLLNNYVDFFDFVNDHLWNKYNTRTKLLKNIDKEYAEIGVNIEHHYLDSKEDPSVLEIPPNTLHGLTPLTDEFELLYWVTESYDPNDELRVPWDHFGKEIWETKHE